MFSATLGSSRNPSKIYNSVSLQTEMPETRISGLMEEVARIQQSMGWGDSKLKTTLAQMSDRSVTKFLLHDQDTHELLGYALVVPQVQNVWNLSQFAIDLSHCRNNNLMQTILDEARKRGVTIILETDPTMNSFYNQFNKRSTSCGYQVQYDYKYTSGMSKIQGIYIFENRMEATERLIREIDNKYPKDEKCYKNFEYLIYSYPQDLDYELIFQWMIQRPHFEQMLKGFSSCGRSTSAIFKFLDFIRQTSDQNMKVTYAKAFARYQSGILIEELHHLDIKFEEDRIALLKLTLEEKRYEVNQFFYKNFKHYGISNPEVMIELIKTSVGGLNHSDAVKEFHYLEFPNNQIKDKLINEMYQGYLVSSDIIFKQGTPLVEQLEEIAKTNGNDVVAWIPYAKITDQDALFRIATNALKGNNWAVQEFERFGIEDEDKRIELFKISAEKNQKTVYEIEKFNIKDEKKRFILAKWLMQHNHHCDLAKNIQKFQISREEDRLEVAKLEAAKKYGYFSDHVDNYQITLEEDRKELARIALQFSPYIFMQNFKKFQISKEADRIEFAELCMKHLWPGYGSDFGSNIGQFEITDEQARIKLGLEAASKGLLGQDNLIMSYEISNEDVIFEMAKLSAVSSSETVAKTVYKYRIRNEKRRIELAKIIACQQNGNISLHIVKFCIRDQEELKNIAIIDTALNAENTSRYIKNYGLINENDRIEVALAAGAQCAPHFNLFEITDMQVHFRIASATASSENTELFIHYLRNFKLNDELWLEIGKLVARHQGNYLYYLLNWTYFSEITAMSLVWTVIRNTDFKTTYDNKKNYCTRLPPCWNLYSPFFYEGANLDHLEELEKVCPESLFAYIEEASCPDDKRIMIKWVIYILGAKLIHNLSEEEFQEVLRNPFIKEIANLSDERLRYKLVDLLVQTKSAVPPESFTSLVVNGCYKIDPHKIYNEPKYAPTFLGGLYQIIHDANLTMDQRNNLLDNIFVSNKPHEVLKMIRIVQSIFILGGESELTKEKYDLNAILLDLFKKKIPIGDIEQFGDKFQATFGSFCDPNLLFIYGAKVKSISNIPLMQAFVLFVETVLNGTFLEERYKKSLHLDKVFKGREETLVEWKKGVKRAWDQKDCCDDETTFSFYDILKDKIKEHGHIDHADCAELIEFFSEPKGVLRKIGEKLKEIKDGTKRTQKLKTDEEEWVTKRNGSEDFEKREINKLYFQRHCIRLMNPKLKPFEQKTELSQMKAYAHKIFCKEHPFLNDIEGLEKPFLNIEYNYDGWTAEDTDDPESLFTCGSVDPGCCQRIDGNINYNKCLLGYVIDGKNRLLCVKNHNGKMIARAIFRILWDEVNQTPVLLVEPIYPSIVKPSIKKAIVRLAKDRAQQLGLPFAQDDNLNIRYQGTLESLSGKAPFEYTDMGQHQTNGVYRIN